MVPGVRLAENLPRNPGSRKDPARAIRKEMVSDRSDIL